VRILRITTCAVEMLVDGLDARAETAYARSRKLRGGDGAPDADAMYELGYAEGAHTAYKVSAERLRKIATALGLDE
jgi:hypothetical protein